MIINLYIRSYKANLRFLENIPKGKEFSKERQFYIRSAANAKRAINRLTLKGE
ncbi:hypothetical protein ON011_003928 [Providencia rettgeri]|nr:hypothetical protein [Providencia rettgeri]